MDAFSDLMHRLEIHTSQPLDVGDYIEQSKLRLKNHPLHSAMFSQLVELKERARITHPSEDEKNTQILRLDNMLLAEGVTGPEKDIQGVDHDEYRVQLQQIRWEYQRNISIREQESAHFIDQSTEVMKRQSQLRPISQIDVKRVVDSVRKKFEYFQMLFKQETCENIMSLKSKFCDARRKRRNFSKSATAILNAYFESNIASPYPTEEIKEQLARQCNISVAQVSNWFGNKRIRFKKTIAKANEDKEMSDVNRRAADVMAIHAAQTMMLPHPLMESHLMGSAPFPIYFPPYEPLMHSVPHPPQ